MHTILFNGYDIVLFITIYICLLFALITLVARRNTESNEVTAHLWLGLFLLSQAGVAGYVLVLYGEAFNGWVIEYFPSALTILEFGFWAEGPLLLLYTRATLYQQNQFASKDTLLLLPLAIYAFTLVFVFSMHNDNEHPVFLHFLQSDYIQYYEHLRNAVRTCFGLWAFVLVRAYQHRLPNAYSNIDQLRYNWLKLLVAGYVVLRIWSLLYLLLYTLLTVLFGENAINHVDFNVLGVLSNVGQLGLLSSLLYFGLSDSKHLTRVTHQTLVDIEQQDHKHSAPLYTQEQVARVRKHMDKVKPYLTNHLKIDDLAHQVSLSPKLLSSLINNEFGMNFFEFINRYRLKEIKIYLAHPEMKDQSIIDLAFKAGYNSKTSFNRLFKLETGKTPSQYRKEVLSKHYSTVKQIIQTK